MKSYFSKNFQFQINAQKTIAHDNLFNSNYVPSKGKDIYQLFNPILPGRFLSFWVWGGGAQSATSPIDLEKY